MTDRENTAAQLKIGQKAGVWLAFLFILACFFGYQVGADLARNDNAKEATARAAP